MATEGRGAVAGGSGAGRSLVFTGSEDQDVALAKTFWNSVTLQPPLESRLAQRRDSSLDGGGGSSSRRSSAARNEFPSARPSVERSKEQRSQEVIEAEKRDVKEQYLKKAKKREDIIALLRKQREERILKESFSNLQKVKSKIKESKAQIPEADLEDKESVKALN